MYWRDERPEEREERCSKCPRFTALCTLNAEKGMLGRYWFQDSRGIRVNEERYGEGLNPISQSRKDLNQLFTLNQKRYLWFQQDDATPDTAHGTMTHLHTLIGNRISLIADRKRMQRGDSLSLQAETSC